ncbi:hypothetical protein [Gordonia hongkongensis]|uniref:hypothetical protein n=1 Tax=Gordonia hongkongensis TaxID=1701090 RepID=UPI003EBF0B94
MRILARFVSRTVLRLAVLAALVVAAFMALSGVVDALPAPADLWTRATTVAEPSRPSAWIRGWGFGWGGVGARDRLIVLWACGIR